MWRNLAVAAVGAALALAGVVAGARYVGELMAPDGGPVLGLIDGTLADLGAAASIYQVGANADVGTSYEDLVDAGGDYPWLTSAITLQVSSSSTADTVAGTGCQTVTISGLAPTTYLEQTDVITTNGQTARVGSKQFIRVNGAYCSQAGTGNVNAGDIYVSDTGTALSSGAVTDATKIRAKILTGNGAALMSVYTVPEPYSAAILRGISIGSEDDTKAMTFQLVRRDFGTNSWRVIWEHVVNGASYETELFVPVTFPAKTDLRLRVKNSAGSDKAAGDFSLLFER